MLASRNAAATERDGAVKTVEDHKITLVGPMTFRQVGAGVRRAEDTRAKRHHRIAVRRLRPARACPSESLTPSRPTMRPRGRSVPAFACGQGGYGVRVRMPIFVSNVSQGRNTSFGGPDPLNDYCGAPCYDATNRTLFWCVGRLGPLGCLALCPGMLGPLPWGA